MATLRQRQVSVILHEPDASSCSSYSSVAYDSRGRFQDGNHVAKDASEGKEEDEGARDEACQQEANEHSFGRCQEGAICQHGVKKWVAQNALQTIVAQFRPLQNTVCQEVTCMADKHMSAMSAEQSKQSVTAAPDIIYHVNDAAADRL